MGTKYRVIVENWNKFVNEEEESSEKPRLKFYEHPNGYIFTDGGAFGDKPVDIEEIADKLREGGLTAGGKEISGKPDTGLVIDMAVVRRGDLEDYEKLMQKIAERLKDNFSLTFKYSNDDKLVSKDIG